MDDLRLHAYYYSFAPTGQREVDLILHAVARAGKAFHHTSQWADDEMEGFYEHCEGDTCEQWIQNAANKAAAELATLRAENDRLRALNLALQQKALDGYRAWDRDQDAKAGKVLKALAGLSPGYWPDIDALRAALGER